MRGKRELISTAPIGYRPQDLFDAKEVSIKDTSSPYSLLTLTDGPLHNAINALPDKLLNMSEAQLKRHCNPDELTCRLRIQFWDEYNAACDAERPLRIANIMRGLTYTEYFYQNVLPDQKKIAWIIKPPQDFLLAMRDLLYIGLDRLREILTTPLIDRTPVFTKDGKQVTDPDGKPVFTEKVNTKILTEIRQITERLSDRVHGAVVQRMQMSATTQNLHVLAQADPLAAVPIDQLNLLDTQLQNINERLALTAQAPTAPADIPPDEEILLDVPDRESKAPFKAEG